MRYGIRIDEKEFSHTAYWADGIADYLIQKYPEKQIFVCAAGISPSGPIHFGNFREVATTFAVAQSLKQKGKEVKHIFSWDNFDRLRKVSASTPTSYEEYIGKALSNIPSPTQQDTSYAEEHQQKFQEAIEQFNIPIEYKDQTKLYTTGAHDAHIITAMQKRKEIADILLAHMTDKGKEIKGVSDEEYRNTYYPISIYSRFTGKDATEVLSYDGKSSIRYRCKISGKEEEIDFTNVRIVKLSWKVDWAMRWAQEDVCFEPGGSDHAAPGGSYDVSSEIAVKIFNTQPPVFTEFGFVGLQGINTKMSGSSGKNITPVTLLNIYEPQLLLWMYLRRLPKQTFSLAFDTEVYRQYDEIDAVMREPANHSATEKRIIEVIQEKYPEYTYKNPIPFRQLVGLAQIAGWNEKKLNEILDNSGGDFDKESVHNRLPKAKAWVTEYNTDALINVRTQKNKEVWNMMDEENKEYVRQLHRHIQQNGIGTIQDIETFLYSLPKSNHKDEKELKQAQRIFFKYVYQLLITTNTGPRMSTFLWSIPEKTVLLLLSPEH